MENPHLPKGHVSLVNTFKSHLLLFSLFFLVVLTSLGVTVYFLTTNKNFKLPLTNTVSQQESTVTLKSEFKNPFHPQYVNPFDSSKSPLYNLKKTK